MAIIPGSLFPRNGVAYPNAAPGADPDVEASCDALWYPNRCNPRVDVASMNAIISEILNVVNFDGTEYDCTVLDNLENAIARVARNVERSHFFATANGDTSAANSTNVLIDLSLSSNFFLDPGTVFSASTLTIGPLDEGVWLFTGFVNLQVLTAPSGGNNFRINTRRNGTDGPLVGSYIADTGLWGSILAQPYRLNAGDTIQLRGFHNTGATRNMTSSNLFGFRLSA